MRLLVTSHKPCWASASSPTGFVTDGGFPAQMRALSELFDETILFLPCQRGAPPAGVAPLQGRNLRVAPATPVPGRGLARKLLFPVWVLLNFGLLLRCARQADAVHAPIPGDVGTVGLLLAGLERKPLFVRYCGNWLKPATLAERLWLRYMEAVAGGRNVILATGEAAQPPSRRNPAISWIFATTLTEAHLAAGAPPRRLRLPPRLIIVCRQTRAKGTDLVIESLARLQSTVPGISLDVVGDGDDLPAFRALAERLGVAPLVRFYGHVEQAQVYPLLLAADVFCFPTQASEGFPKAVLEALAAGLPVIATRVSSLPALLSRGCGLLLERADAAELAAQVQCLLEHPQQYDRMSAAARMVAQDYSLEAWRDRIGQALRPAWGPLSHA